MAERIALRSMPGVQKEFALHRPKLGPRTCGRQFGDDEDDADPADSAVDVTPVLTEAIAPDDLQLISEHFASALVWATDAKSMVEMGWRMATMLRLMRPALVEGMALEARLELQADLTKALAGRDPLETGEYYRALLAWCRRCKTLSQMGQRTFAMIYVLRRDLLSGRNTNAAIASLQNKTRQAFNRTVGNFRDTFRGFRNAVMRGEGTRTKCRKAQQT
jgi:hypothetical protein